MLIVHFCARYLFAECVVFASVRESSGVARHRPIIRDLGSGPTRRINVDFRLYDVAIVD